MRLFIRRFALAILLVSSLVAGWIAFDLLYPSKKDLRDFDADEVARLDTAMWGSYYDRDRVGLFLGLSEVLGKQYGFRFWRRQLVAYHAAKAAFIFKNGNGREDYEKSIPEVEKFFSEIRDAGTIDFDPKRAAQLEVEWWIVHRERKKYSEDDLAWALAAAAGEVYQMPAEAFHEYGKLRAQAMSIRDEQAESGSLNEDDWAHIDELLVRSWRSLRASVNSSPHNRN